MAMPGGHYRRRFSFGWLHIVGDEELAFVVARFRDTHADLQVEEVETRNRENGVGF